MGKNYRKCVVVEIETLPLAFIICMILVLIAIILDMVFMFYLWKTSDYHYCNGLFCTFVKERERTIVNKTIIEECYINGVRVNCSEIEGGLSEGRNITGTFTA